jgi:hypothetical protein
MSHEYTLKNAGLLLLVLLQGCSSMTSERQHPEFDTNRKYIERVAIMPPSVSIQLITFTGENEHLKDKEKNAREFLDQRARNILKQRGYGVCEMHFEELAANDPELAFQIEQLKNAYEVASKDLYNGEAVAADDYKRFRVTVGPIVNRFAELAEADALLFINFEGIVKSKGEIRKEIAANILLGTLTGSYASPVNEASAVEVSLLDANTGDVLWTNIYSDSSVSAVVLRGALEKIPVKTAPATASESMPVAEPETGTRNSTTE